MLKLNYLHNLLPAMALVIAAATTLPSAVEATEPAESATEGSSATSEATPVLQAGRVVHVDPATGRKNAAPSPAERAVARAHLQSMVNRSTVGLFETASPASGVMVNLQGRFRHASSLSVSGAGDATSVCTAGLPPEAQTLDRQGGER